MLKNLSFGVTQEFEILPDELGLDDLRDRGSASGWSSQGMTTSPGLVGKALADCAE